MQGINGAVRDETLLQVTVPIMFVQVLSFTSTIVPFEMDSTNYLYTCDNKLQTL